MIRRALVSGCCFALGSIACASVRSGANPELPSWAHRPSWSMSVAFKQRIVAPSREVGEAYERGRPAIDPDGRRVFVGSRDRGLYAVSAEDGRTLWRFETLGPVQSEPLYDPGEDVVYFGSNDGALYKVAASNGKLVWRFMTNAEVARAPVLTSDGWLYVVNANDTVMALEPKSGKLRWSQHRAPALGMEIAGYAGPLVWEGIVYVAFSDGNVTAFDRRTGEERWQPVDLSAEAEDRIGDVPQYFDVDTTPVPGYIDGAPVIFVGSYEAGAFALDAVTGVQAWANPAVLGVTDLLRVTEPAHAPRRGDGPAVPERSVLIASTGTSGIWALDPENGREIWRRGLPDGGVSAPVPILGALMVTTTRQGLFLLSLTDGAPIDGLDLGDGFSMPAAAFGAHAFAVTNFGDLLHLRVSPPG